MNETARELALQLAENRQRLESCDGHAFHDRVEAAANELFTCTKCGGAMRQHEKLAYEKGFRHGYARGQEIA